MAASQRSVGIKFVNVNILVLFFLVAFTVMVLRERRKKYPPGPPGLPVVGVARIHQQKEYWKTYAQWGVEYGRNTGMIYFHVLGRHFLVINSSAVAKDLLTMRGSIYSGRPVMPMVQLLGIENNITDLNTRTRAYRKLFDQALNANTSKEFWSILEDQSQDLVTHIINQPDKFYALIQENTLRCILKLAYAAVAMKPGAWLVDAIPVLRFLPSWFPGSKFKRLTREWAPIFDEARLELLDFVHGEIARGKAERSFASRLLYPNYEAKVGPEQEDIISYAADSMFVAGTDTITSCIKTFIYQMVMNPEIQRCAQQEIDNIVREEGRLPTLADRPSLPYVDAIMKEVFRWAPAAPLSLPHCTAQDNVYQGYLIPAGTTILENIWTMAHDADTYPDPMRFRPERYLGENAQLDPTPMVFGFGKRTCPGRHVAEASVFIQIAMLLATVEMTKKMNEKGQAAEPEARFVTAAASYLEPFPCQFTPRDVGAKMLASI